METLKTFRHELKYIVSYEDMLNIREKLNKVLTIDRNESGYMVRSLYFDGINDNDYYDKLGGEIDRKKIRLRIYEPNADKVKLELKSKYDTHQLKKSLVINKKDAEELIKENYSILLNYNSEVAKEIYLILRENLYKPKIIIEYNRIAYITSTTTRITFDFDIKESTNIEDFFNENINYYDLTNKKDIVLEVKFDRFLEPYISNILSSCKTTSQSVSKYIIGRNV